MAKNLWDRRVNFMYMKVGSFFLIAIFILFLTLLSIKEVNVFKGSYPMIVKFNFVEGLRVSSPVRFCGVDVGEVKKIVIKKEDNRPLVFVHIKIQKGINIPSNSYFFVNSLSLFGEKYLEINPSLITEGYIDAGEVVEGISPVPLFNVVASFDKTMEEIRSFVQEGKLKTSLETIVSNMEHASSGIKSLVEAVQDKKGTLGRLFYDESLYDTTEEFIKDLKKHPWKLLHKPKGK